MQRSFARKVTSIQRQITVSMLEPFAIIEVQSTETRAKDIHSRITNAQ